MTPWAMLVPSRKRGNLGRLPCYRPLLVERCAWPVVRRVLRRTLPDAERAANYAALVMARWERIRAKGAEVTNGR